MQIPMHLGKNSHETLYICSIDLPAAIGFFVPHTDFEILEICEFASNPDELPVPEISLLDNNVSHQWKGIRKYLFDTIHDTSLVRLSLKGANETQGHWEFFYNYGEFHYRNTDSQEFNNRLTQFLHFSHLPVTGLMTLLDACMPKSLLIEGYFGMEDVDLQERMQTEIEFQKQNSWQIQHNPFEWENRFFEDYVPERLLPMDVQLSDFFNRHPPVSFYLQRADQFTTTVFLVLVNEQLEPLHPMYQDWFDNHYEGDWKARLEQALKYNDLSYFCKDFFVLQSENNQNIYQFSVLRVPENYKSMEYADFELWFLDRWKWTLSSLNRDESCAIFSLELHEGLGDPVFTEGIHPMISMYKEWSVRESKQHCLFFLPQTREDYERLMDEKVKFIPAVKDLNPDDKIVFRFYLQMDSWTNMDLKSSRNEENPFI